jgi:valyl-tRNA synthetase
VFLDIEKEVDEIILFIKEFRNTLKENNIFGEYSINIKFEENIINNILKLNEKKVNDILNKTSFIVKTNNYEAIIYYEKKITVEDIRLKEKEINELKASIEKRKNLLSNKSFLEKAPSKLIDNEKEKLEFEINKLEKLQS